MNAHSTNPAAHSAPAKASPYTSHDAIADRVAGEARIAHLAQRALLLAVAIRNTDKLLAETRK
jgi:hypothetical protein